MARPKKINTPIITEAEVDQEPVLEQPEVEPITQPIVEPSEVEPVVEEVEPTVEEVEPVVEIVQPTMTDFPTREELIFLREAVVL
jgi:hypothetical protein